MSPPLAQTCRAGVTMSPHVTSPAKLPGQQLHVVLPVTGNRDTRVVSGEVM